MNLIAGCADLVAGFRRLATENGGSETLVLKTHSQDGIFRLSVERGGGPPPGNFVMDLRLKDFV